jgi:hypothetical protein
MGPVGCIDKKAIALIQSYGDDTFQPVLTSDPQQRIAIGLYLFRNTSSSGVSHQSRPSYRVTVDAKPLAAPSATIRPLLLVKITLEY